VVSIDPFQSTQWRGAGRRLLRESGVEHLHSLLEEKAESALPRLIAEGARFDLALIDGDHRFEYAFVDVFFARRLLGSGKLIVMDDGWMPSVRKCAAFFEAAGLCGREPTPVGSPLSKFILLRVTSEGDAREWNEFTNF